MCFPDETAYTSDWAKHFLANAERHLLPLAGRPLKVLEIGVFEGRSARWLFQHLLTHPESRYVGIDAWGWDDGTEERAHANLAPFLDRIEFHKGDSRWVLRDGQWKPGSFDLVYIDGCHRALSVLTDSVLAWPLLKVGGLCVWDDYQWSRPLWKRRRLPRHLRPKEAIDAFLMSITGDHERVFKNYQLGVRKTADPPGPGRPA